MLIGFKQKSKVQSSNPEAKLLLLSEISEVIVAKNAVTSKYGEGYEVSTRLFEVIDTRDFNEPVQIVLEGQDAEIVLAALSNLLTRNHHETFGQSFERAQAQFIIDRQATSLDGAVALVS